MTNGVDRLGPSNGKRCFYLPSPPELPPQWQCEQPDSLEQLITLNGNHWRKILVIMAKLSAPDSDWRTYRPRLLKHQEQILFNSHCLSPHAAQHFICGQQSALALGLTPLSEPQSFHYQQSPSGTLILLPYLDYRQCPNQLIERIRQQLAQP